MHSMSCHVSTTNGCHAGVPLENAFMWADFQPPISDNCSVVRAAGATNVFESNHAQLVGGAVYATDKASLNVTCLHGLPGDVVGNCPTPAWAGNMVDLISENGIRAGYASEVHSRQSATTPLLAWLAALLAQVFCCLHPFPVVQLMAPIWKKRKFTPLGVIMRASRPRSSPRPI